MQFVRVDKGGLEREGLFHGFFQVKDEYEARPVAMVQDLTTGRITQEHPEMVKFIEDPRQPPAEIPTVKMGPEVAEAFNKFMNTGAEDTDPYWGLFKVKDEVNDALVKAVKYGYFQGYGAGQRSNLPGPKIGNDEVLEQQLKNLERFGELNKSEIQDFINRVRFLQERAL